MITIDRSCIGIGNRQTCNALWRTPLTVRRKYILYISSIQIIRVNFNRYRLFLLCVAHKSIGLKKNILFIVYCLYQSSIIFSSGDLYIFISNRVITICLKAYGKYKYRATELGKIRIRMMHSRCMQTTNLTNIV